MKRTIENNDPPKRQSTEDLVELYTGAARVINPFKDFMEDVAKTTGAKLDLAPLKQLSRIMEKVSHARFLAFPYAVSPHTGGPQRP